MAECDTSPRGHSRGRVTVAFWAVVVRSTVLTACLAARSRSTVAFAPRAGRVGPSNFASSARVPGARLLRLRGGETRPTCYYEILGLHKSEKPGENQIKHAYHKMALQCHPDRVAPEKKEESERAFKALKEAYDVLMDPYQRQCYDGGGYSTEWAQYMPPASEHDMPSAFDDIAAWEKYFGVPASSEGRAQAGDTQGQEQETGRKALKEALGRIPAGGGGAQDAGLWGSSISEWEKFFSMEWEKSAAAAAAARPVDPDAARPVDPDPSAPRSPGVRRKEAAAAPERETAAAREAESPTARAPSTPRADPPASPLSAWTAYVGQTVPLATGVPRSGSSTFTDTVTAVSARLDRAESAVTSAREAISSARGYIHRAMPLCQHERVRSMCLRCGGPPSGMSEGASEGPPLSHEGGGDAASPSPQQYAAAAAAKTGRGIQTASSATTAGSAPAQAKAVQGSPPAPGDAFVDSAVEWERYLGLPVSV